MELEPKKIATVDSKKFSMENFDDDVCDLVNSYLGTGFVSSNNEQFFNDKDLVTEFNYHIAGLKTLLEHTRGIENGK